MRASRLSVGMGLLLLGLAAMFVVAMPRLSQAAPGAQAPSELPVDQEDTPDVLDFTIEIPDNWELAITNARKAEFSYQEEVGIFVTAMELSPEVSLDAVLAIAEPELRGGFLDFQERSRGTGLQNGYDYIDLEFDAAVDGGDGALEAVRGRVLFTAGDEQVFMVLGLVTAAALDEWWTPLSDSMDTFAPSPGPAPGTGFSVTGTELASDVVDCQTNTLRETSAFVRGERFYVLINIFGATSEPNADGERVVLTVTDVSLLDAQGTTLFQSADLEPVTLETTTGFDDLCLWIWVEIDEAYPTGPVTAHITLEDTIGQQETSLRVPFMIFDVMPAPITVGTPTRGTVTTPSGETYSVQLEAGTSYLMEVDLDTLSDSVLRLTDVQGEEVAYDDDSGSGLASRMVYTPARAGSYFLTVEGYQADQGTYTLTLDPLEDFLATAISIEVGQETSGALTGAGPNLYAVDLEVGTTYQMEVGLGTLGDSELTLWSAYGDFLDYNDDVDWSLASQITWTATEAGVHYLLVDGYGSALGSYTLTVTPESPMRGSDPMPPSETPTPMPLPFSTPGP